MSVRPRRRLVIGIGHPDRGDDAVGRVVARGLRGRVPDRVEVLETDGEASRLLELLAEAAVAWIIDAAVSGAPPGTIRRLDPTATALPRTLFAVSSHGLGLAEAIELARALGSLPRRLVVYAIEAEGFAPGAPLTPAVEAAALEVEARLLGEVGGEPVRLPGPAHQERTSG
jgi:hydrogenase maturation protease